MANDNYNRLNLINSAPHDGRFMIKWCNQHGSFLKLPLSVSLRVLWALQRKKKTLIQLYFDRDRGGNILHYVSIDRSLLREWPYSKKLSFGRKRKKKNKHYIISAFKVNHALVINLTI